MAKRLEDTIRKIMLSEAGPDSIPGRVEPTPAYDELGGPIVANNQAGIDFSKPIKPGQAALPKQGGGGPENNPTKYKSDADIDPKKQMSEEEEEDDEKDKIEEGRLPAWLKSKLSEETDEDEDDEEEKEKKEVSERYVREEDEDEKGEDDNDEDDKEDVKEEKEEDEDDEEEGEKEVNEAYFAERHASAKQVSEEALAALFEGTKISQGFRDKLSTVFEAAVAARAEVIEEETQARAQLALEQSVSQISEQVTNQVDSYLNYVVEQWLEENTLAVERGIRSELTESFISGMKSLFEEHYIDVPEKKVDVVNALAERNDELESKLNSVLNENITLRESVNELQKSNMIREATEGMPESTASKFRTLAEGIDFGSNFKSKLETLKETSFTKTPVKKVNLTEDAEFGNTEEKTKNTDPLIERTKQILDRNTRK